MTIVDSISFFADTAGDKFFLFAPGRAALPYSRLKEHIEKIVADLSDSGLQPGDRIAVLMENGPEQVTAILSVMAFSTVVPLNPAYTMPELSAFLEMIHVRAVICDRSSESKAGPVCSRLNILCLPLIVDDRSMAGIFRLKENSGDPGLKELPSLRRRPEDIAAVFLTSGTSARPKIVPLSQDNIGWAAEVYCKSYAMTADDRVINVLSLFHIHGFISVLMATVVSGGSMVCMPGFDPGAFFQALADFEPTWYPAGPTVHRAIAEYARSQPSFPRSFSLRRMSSGAAPLSVSLIAELESLFSAPMIEGYGMTETCAGVLLNPIPPGKRVPGSVGLPIGCEVRIVDEKGNPAPAGTVGEIALRGRAVFEGYEEEGCIVPARIDGWFHTGDLGYADSEGYIFIVGRCKEMINRGGQKIAPREVDEALMEIPQIKEAGCFAVSHPRLGEDVAAALVLESGAEPTPKMIRVFLRERLADYKIPRRICFFENLPKGPTGKLLRNNLAEMAAKAQALPNEAPRTETEKQLAGIWCEMLNLAHVGVEDDFFEMGGDSLLAETLMAEIASRWYKEFPATLLLESGTIAALAEKIEQAGDTGSVFVPLRAGGSRSPLYFLHAIDGDVMAYKKLVENIGSDQPVYGVRFSSGTEDIAGKIVMSELVEKYATALKIRHALGPYRLAGHSFGGILAFETACRLAKDGCEVEFVAMIDTDLSKYQRKGWQSVRHSLKIWAVRLRRKWPEIIRLSWRERIGLADRVLRTRRETARKVQKGRREQTGVRKELGRIARSYQPSSTYSGNLHIFHAQDETERYLCYGDATLGWSPWVRGGVEVVYVPGDHYTVIRHPQVLGLAEKLTGKLKEVDEKKMAAGQIE